MGNVCSSLFDETVVDVLDFSEEFDAFIVLTTEVASEPVRGPFAVLVVL